jgi:predicted membrane protein (TIGR00267 family)
MRSVITRHGARHRLDVVAGFSDGILTALTLGAGHMLSSHTAMSLSLALRVGAAAAVSGAFIFMVAHYAELRGELVEAERQLNLTARGRLATSQLGRSALLEATIAALIASVCTFLGAMLPLLVGVFFPDIRWLSIVVALVALTLLGYLLARVVYGHPLRWCGVLVLGGITLAFIGMRLDIV